VSRLWSVRLIYQKGESNVGFRTAVTAAASANEAKYWLECEVRDKGELPGFRIAHGEAEDITDYAYAFVAANPRGPQ
jgi:hypothetical protein